MPKPTKKPIGTRISEKSAEFYTKTFPTATEGVNYVADAFPGLCQKTMAGLQGRFTHGELMLMIDVNNGLWLTPRIAGQQLDIQVSDGIALDHLDEKWEIDADTLNGKIAALSIFEAACLELWVQAFWNQPEHSNIEEWVKKLAE